MASTLFSGTSRYSQDISQVIDRSVAIASLPLKQMQQQRIKTSDESTALKGVEAKVLALQGALSGLEGKLGTNAWQASSSDINILRPSFSDGVAEGNYTLQVNSLGAFSTAVSTVDPDPSKNISDPSNGNFVTAGSTQLTVTLKDWDTGATTVLDPASISGTSLQDVVKTINDKFGTQIKAAIVNLGSTNQPNYQLSIQSVNLGKIAIQVNDGARDLMNVNMSNNADASLGALVEYKVNGATVRGNSRAITIAPNLTANLLSAQPGKDVTVTVGRSTDNFKTALNTFISSFNTVVSELDQQATGVLKGNSILSTIRTQLRSIVTSPISDGFDSLANIGVEFTREGTLTLNSVLFNEATEGKLDSLKNAIGSSSTSGFLKLATNVLNAVEHEGTGLLNSTIQTLDDSGKAQDSRIDGEQDRIDQLTRDLQARMAAADAMIAQLEQQATYFTNLFKTMNDSQNSNR